MAFVETKAHLISLNLPDWTWRSVHSNDYPSQPWSMTPLKKLWHRNVPVGGNSQTPNVSKYALDRTVASGVFKSHHTANYKSVFELADDPKVNVNLLSIDTGMSGNLLGGHYFDMNANHLAGKLEQVETDIDKLGEVYTLVLKSKV